MSLVNTIKQVKRKNRYADYLIGKGFDVYYTLFIQNFRKGKRVHETEKGFKMKLDISESEPMIGRKLATYERSISDFLQESLESGDTYINIGANKGYHVLEASQILQEGKAVAFEPNPENIKDLKENLDLNEVENVDIEEKAIGDKNGELGFKTTKMSGTGELVSDGEEKDYTVEVQKFDTFLDNHEVDPPEISVIKIDVEGAELEVLNGMNSFLEKNDVCLVVEVHEDKINLEEFLSNIEEKNLDIIEKIDNFYFLKS